MVWWFTKRNGPDQGRRARAAERFVAAGLSCALGDVLDLSATGVRLRGSGKVKVDLGDILTITVASENQSVKVQSQVVWVRRRGLGRQEIGLKFVNVRKGVATALVQLARYGFITTDPASVAHAEEANEAAKVKAKADAGEPQAPGAGQPGTDGRPPLTAAVDVEDLYAMLGVERNAPESAIKKAYHRMALEYHPDRNQSPDAARKFAEISKAYSVLRDEAMRSKYDAMLTQAVKAA
jgi:DnaJ-domain-containing protein 1